MRALQASSSDSAYYDELRRQGLNHSRIPASVPTPNENENSSFGSMLASFTQADEQDAAESGSPAQPEVKSNGTNTASGAKAATTLFFFAPAAQEKSISAQQVAEQASANGVKSDPSDALEIKRPNARGTAAKLPATQAPTSNKTLHKPSEAAAILENDQADVAQLSSEASDASAGANGNRGGTGQASKSARKPAADSATGIEQPEPSGAPNNASAITGDPALALRVSTGSSNQMQGQSDAALKSSSLARTLSAAHGQPPIAAPIATSHDAALPPLATAANAVTDQGSPETSGEPAEASATGPADFAAELEKYQAASAKSVHVQIAGEENQRVDVRLFERAGQLAVTFRSPDAGLTRTLQEQAPDLASSLEQQHYRTELWTPSATKPDDQGSNQNNSSPQGQGRPPDRQNGNGNPQQRQPKWVADLETGPTGSQKRIEYTWHQ